MEKRQIKNIAFCGYDFFYSCFESLIEHGYNIKWLFTSECDNKYNFNIKIIDHAKKVDAKIYTHRISKADINDLIAQGCDLIIAASYPYRIPIVEHMPFALNIHPSLLPDGRGPWPLPCTILRNLQTSGVTIHKLDAFFDTGDILLQREFVINEKDNLETLSCRAQMLAEKLIIDLLNQFEFYWQNATVQTTGSYWPMPTFDDRQLEWNLSVKEIDRIFRAFGKFDSLAQFDNLDWIVKDLSAWEEKHNFEIGTVVHRTSKEVVIAARDGLVCLRFFERDLD